MVSVLGSNHTPSEPGNIPLHLRYALHPELIQSHVHASLSHSPKGKRSSCRHCLLFILCSPPGHLKPFGPVELSPVRDTGVAALVRPFSKPKALFFHANYSLSTFCKRTSSYSIFNNYGTALRKEQQWAYHCKRTGLILHSALLPPFRDLCAVSFAYTNGKIKLPDKGRVARTTSVWVPPSTF